MCGILGVWHFDRRPVDLATLAAASASLWHRGPDDEGYLLVTPNGSYGSFAGRDTPSEAHLPSLPTSNTDASLAFAFRRLSILDLSTRGHQPMCDRTQRRWLVYNGEIYNYKELRHELRGHGYAFCSESDSEVLLAAYDLWGARCVERLNGMFAFAIWDGIAGRLFCARDRFGIKPFYYIARPDLFAFASEVKALLPYCATRDPDLPYLRRFLDTGLSDDGADTFLAEVKGLLPAHTLDIAPNRLDLRRYWNVVPIAAPVPTGADAEEAFRELLMESIRLQMRSDVPVGACASGGIDSSAIVSIATKIANRPMHSFSAVYPDPGYDEGRYVDTITSAMGTIATRVTPSPGRWFELLDRITWHQDGPTAVGGAYTQWHVMEAAQGKVTVLLDGQGGDELFAGYFRYLPVLVRDLWHRVGSGDWGHLSRAVRETASLTWRWREHFEQWNAAQFVRAGLQRARARSVSPDRDGLYRGLLASAGPAGMPAPAIPSGLDPLNSALYRDVTAASVPMLLRFEDRSSMAFHLEARVPFLDHRLVEFALSLPGEAKVENGLAKAFMRRALRGIVPAGILDRRDKKGYPTPWAEWLRGPLRQETWAFLHDRVLARGWYDSGVLAQRWEQHVTRTHDWSAAIARWMTTEIWWRQVVEGAGL